MTSTSIACAISFSLFVVAVLFIVFSPRDLLLPAPLCIKQILLDHAQSQARFWRRLHIAKAALVITDPPRCVVGYASILRFGISRVLGHEPAFLVIDYPDRKSVV